MTTETRSREAAAHRATAERSVADVVAFLQETLGSTLVAHMAGVADTKTVSEWAKGPRQPRPETERRLRLAFQVFQMLQQEDDPYTVRAWFIGLNPQLDDEAPAAAIREDRLKDVVVAARAFMTGA